MPLSSPFLSKSPLVQLSGWWVGLGAVGQNKMCCNLCRLMRLVAALFILRRVGILSVCFSVCLLSAVLSFSMTGNVWQLAEGGDIQHNLSYEELKFTCPQNCPTKHETATFGKVLLPPVVQSSACLIIYFRALLIFFVFFLKSLRCPKPYRIRIFLSGLALTTSSK